MSTSATTTTFSDVDAAVWRAVAGTTVDIPSINSYVYYFPQGHLERSETIQNTDITLRHSFIPCQVLSVRFLSSTLYDELSVKILLRPLLHRGGASRPINSNNGEEKRIQNQNDDVVSFAKILTPSDANNGGGFSVPRFCADSIFPALDFDADPPVQNLTMKDTRGGAWAFRHIYRGTPRRHLLTTGWSKFVNAKSLVTGDSVVFMRKKSTSELFAGVRRGQGFGAKSGGDGDGRSGREVLEAIGKAAKGMEFEVVYFPRVGFPDFVVRAEKVEDALRLYWIAGMRVKMAVETEDSSRVTWFQGTVTGTALPKSGPWFGSPWRMLQVTWDDSDIFPNMNRVNPWQVEHNPQPHSPLPPPKRLKLSENPSDGEGEFVSPRTYYTHSIGLHQNPTMFNYSPFPPSMQGARPDHHQTYNNPNSQIFDNNSYQTFTELLMKSEEIEPELETVSTVLNIGIAANTDKLSPESQSSVHCSNSGTTKVGVNSIQLFGTTIRVSQSVEGSSGSNVRYRNGERKNVEEERNVD